MIFIYMLLYLPVDIYAYLKSAQIFFHLQCRLLGPDPSSTYHLPFRAHSAHHPGKTLPSPSHGRWSNYATYEINTDRNNQHLLPDIENM